MKKSMFIASVLILFLVTGSWAIDVKKDAALVGLWLFDDQSGAVVKDSSGNDHCMFKGGKFLKFGIKHS